MNPTNSDNILNPFQIEPSNIIRESDHVILHFGDGRQIFCQALSFSKGKSPSLKISKRTYQTRNLIGLHYGTVLEVPYGGKELIPLPEGEDIFPNHDDALAMSDDDDDSNDDEVGEESNNEDEQSSNNFSYDKNNSESLSTKRKNGLLGTSHTTENNTNEFSNDNRHLVDDNTSQAITQGQVEQMRADPAMHGSKIVAKIIQNSSTFKLKTSYSQAKYVRRKQIKYQPRCRLVRCTPSSMCQALYLKDSRKLMNLREDSLAQILSYSNLCAGKRVIVFDTCLGVVLGSCAQRMGGYGTIFGLYTGFAPPYVDWISKFNLSFVEQNSIHWVHTGQLFHDEESDEGDKEQPEKNILDDKDQEVDMELQEREQLLWPCPLQTHTEQYISKMKTDQERYQFLLKRNSRFARKMTRSTSQEILRNIMDPKRKCQSLIIACKYDPTSTLLSLIQYLEPSCPFVVFYEYLEPLAHCFQIIQEKGLAINLRLCDTWMREYQVLPGRTHPNMTMSQNGGFILTGIKLCPQFGKNELDEHVLKDLRSQYYRRRKGNQKRKLEGGDNEKTKKDMKIN